MNANDNFTCNKCGKKFNLEHHLTRHNARKTPCIKPNNGGTEFKCGKCEKSYSTKYNLTKHQKICKAEKIKVNTVPTNVEEQIRLMTEEIKQLKEERARKDEEQNAEIAALKTLIMEKAVVSAPVINNTVNIVGNNNRVNCYFAPNTKYLIDNQSARDILIAAINKYGVQLPFHLIQPIWFNINHPENHSIRHIKGNIYQVQDDFGVQAKDLNEVAKDVRNVVHDISSDLICSVSDNREHREFANNIRNNKCFQDATTEKEIENVRENIVAGSKNIGKN